MTPDIITVAYPTPEHAMMLRDRSAISDLIVHHTAGPIEQTPLDIDREHRNQGWSMIGYNFVIAHDGTIYKGRDPQYVPAAAYGRNTESINVVLVGNFQEGDTGFTGDPSHEQLESLEALVAFLHKQYPSIVRTIGHRDVATLFFGGDGNYATACPGSLLYAQLPIIKARIAHDLNLH